MSLLDELKKSHGLFVRCPNSECETEFPLSKVNLFDATKPLPPQVLAYIAKQKQDLRRQRADLKRCKIQTTAKSEMGAHFSKLGKVLEKIAPSLPGFPVVSADCRALFEPIDYVVFKGLSAKGVVDCISFVDVKTGKGKLTGEQPQIRRLVLSKKIKLTVTPRGQEVS